MAVHGGWFQTRTRVIALLAATVSGLFGLAMASSASAQPSPVQHVIVLYLENHSFDNLLKYWCNDNPGRCPDNGMPSSVTLSNGQVVTPDVMPDKVPKVDHAVKAQQKAIDGGKMDGWQQISGCAAPTYSCIGGYTPSQVPNLTGLANSFAINNRTFSMADNPS